jgi:Heparinase II/III-like protein/Heparinase II/III N-terminus/Polysaccharide deacetylase
MTVLILGLFAAKMANYLAPQLLNPRHDLADLKQGYDRVSFKIKSLPIFNSCASGTHMVSVPGGYVCADNGAPASIWSSVFSHLPIDGGASDAVYSSTDVGTQSAANDLLAGRFDIPRYPAYAATGPLTWSEDPYQAVYWRLNFYSLRPTLNLLYAYRTTGDARYARRLVALDDSFFGAEASSPYAWSDDHAVAFRSMALVDSWWRLRQGHMLSEAESRRYLMEIQKTGVFLADPNHYQPQHNHGINEAAALLQIAVDFPDMPQAHAWRATATTRLDTSIHSLVDPDGVLIENSPYYQFYALDKLWQIDRWAKATHVALSPDFESRLGQMINYATYILQPDSSVPLLGASLATTIHDHGTYAQMGESNPYFEYVLTHGAEGQVPPHTSVSFSRAGQTIMRSGWGTGSNFTAQSFLTFNVGPYRTTHSNLDSLAITLYGDGTTLLPGAGLYTYSPGTMRDYFHGTASHDTVVVDGRDQAVGNAMGGVFAQKDGITYQSGESSLYAGVTHRRVVMMLDPTHYLVTDRLTSSSVHTYTQMFHLFSGAHVTTHGLTVTGTGTKPGQSLTISQIDTAGITEGSVTGQTSPPAGICSEQYQVSIPCPAISYAQRGTNVEFTTLLTIGHSGAPVTVRHDAARDVVHIGDGDRRISVAISNSSPVPEVASGTHTEVPLLAGTSPVGFLLPSTWQVVNGPPARPLPPTDRSGGPGIALTSAGSATEIATLRGAVYNGSNANLEIRMKVSAVENLSHLDIELSNNNWATVMSDDLRNAYPPVGDREWIAISLGRGQALSGQVGHWAQSGPGTFDWSKVDGVRLVVEGKAGLAVPVTVEVNQLQAVPAQHTGKVVIIFDDGYQSILSAASYLHKLGMPATVAVIAKYADLPTQDHLNVAQLQMLQNKWGWNMVNHTLHHVDGVATYADTGDLAGYQEDVVAGAQFLESADLNSAPNWFVYPHGTTDDGLKSVLANLYRFARTTQNEPEGYPFADPLAVEDLEVQSPLDSEAGAQGKYTSPVQVASAVDDAKRFGNTLLLTFHRIHATPTDPPGYSLPDFEAIANRLKSSGIPVLTLSGLDKSNGIPENNYIQVIPGHASQSVVNLKVSTTGQSRSLWDRLTGWL